MIYNNLNRVKGILSARLGTEIPKFLNGEKIYKKLLDGNEVFSYDGEGWFYVNNPSKPFTMSESPNFRNIHHYDEEQRLIYKRIEVSDNGGQHFLSEQYKIPGGLEATPYTSVENAANFNLQVNEARTQAVITNLLKELAPKEISHVDGGLKKAVSLNVPPVDTTELSSGIQKLLEEKLNEPISISNKNLSNAVQGISSGIQIVGNAFGLLLAATDSNTTKNITAVYDGIALTASNFGPWGQAASAIMGMAEGAGNIIQAITGGNDLMTKTDLWMSSPLLSWNAGIINDIGAKKSDDFGVDLNIMALVGSSYGGTAADLQDAASKAGKKYGLFSTKARKQANASIALAKSKQNLLENIADDAMDQRLSVQSMGEQAGLAYSMMTSGGYNQKYTYAAKHGGLLEWNPVVELEWEPRVELNWELPTLKLGGSIDFVEELEWIPEFKDGGKTEESDIPETEETTQKNVIPEGALHKNKHHMEHAEGLTKKGIPVVDEDGEQQAEIEHSEIIFTLEVTKKLEEYYEIFYSEESTNKEKEQAALDAGKLLVYQILENTEDRTGLIESCKKGGSLTLKKSTDDLIEEVLEWIPTVVIVETEEREESKEEKLKKKLVLDSKEELKLMIKEVLVELLIK